MLAKFNADASGEWCRWCCSNGLTDATLHQPAELLAHTRLAADTSCATPMDAGMGRGGSQLWRGLFHPDLHKQRRPAGDDGANPRPLNQHWSDRCAGRGDAIRPATQLRVGYLLLAGDGGENGQENLDQVVILNATWAVKRPNDSPDGLWMRQG